MSASRPPKLPNRRHPRPGPFLLIFGYCVALLYPLTLLGQSLYWGDVFLYFQPMQEFVQTTLRDGQIPLWNPYVLCGQPLVGNPQSWVFYPTTLLLPYLPVWTYLTVNHLLHLCLAGLGAYLFVRRLCGDRLSGVLAAVTFVGSGFIMVRLQFPTMVQAAAYLPWLMLLADRLIERPGIGYASLLTATVALQILAGHAQVAYMGFVAATVYFFARLYQARSHTRRARQAFSCAVAAFLLGVLLSSVQILPMAQLFGLSTRERLTWSQANRFALSPGDLIHYVLPYWHGSPARGDFWGSGNLWESCLYVGIVPLVLACLAAGTRMRRRSVLFFSLMAILSLWLALGRYGGLFWVAFYIVPGLASFHDPARFTFVTTFALAVLAGLGLRALRDRGWSGPSRAALIVVAAVNLWVFSAHLNPTIDPAVFAYRPRSMASAPLAGEGRVFTAQRNRVWERYLNYSDFGPESARYAHELTDTLSPNIGMRYGVEEGSGYEPVPVKAVTEVDARVRAAMERKDARLDPLLGLFNTTVLLLPEMTRFRHEGLVDLPARGTTVLAIRDPFPRAWIVRKTRRIDGAKRALAAISAPDFQPRREAITSGAPGLGSSSNPSTQFSVDVERRSPGHFSLFCDAGDAPGFLVLSETWFPGWQAKVNGQAARIQRTNHAFRGLALPKGSHHVEFAYRPAAFHVGFYLSLVATFFVAGGLTAGFVFRAQRSGCLQERERKTDIESVK